MNISKTGTANSLVVDLPPEFEDNGGDDGGDSFEEILLSYMEALLETHEGIANTIAEVARTANGLLIAANSHATSQAQATSEELVQPESGGQPSSTNELSIGQIELASTLIGHFAGWYHINQGPELWEQYGTRLAEVISYLGSVMRQPGGDPGEWDTARGQELVRKLAAASKVEGSEGEGPQKEDKS